MNDSKWGAARCCARLGLIVVCWGGAPALAGAPTQNGPASPGATPSTAVSVEMVVFADSRRAPVRLLRGAPHPAAPARAARVQILTLKPRRPGGRLIPGLAPRAGTPPLRRAPEG